MNNKLIKDVIKKQCPNVKKYELRNNSIIYTDEFDKKFVAKKNDNNIIELYNHLNSRGFNYLPKLEYCNRYGYVYDYSKDIDTPREQKMNDLIKLDALLHNKTAYYKDISIDEVKETYDNLKEKIENIFNYYDDLITMIDGEVYMSPSEYMLARNCSTIFSCINFCRKELDEWYKLYSNKTKERIVLLHNNLDISHLIKHDNDYLISWNKAIRDLPIYDFINLYKKNYNKYDFISLFNEYEKKFQLLEEEKKLMFIILFIPEKIYFNTNELESTIKVSKLCNYLYLTDKLFMEQKTKNSKKQNQEINE